MRLPMGFNMDTSTFRHAESRKMWITSTTRIKLSLGKANLYFVDGGLNLKDYGHDRTARYLPCGFKREVALHHCRRSTVQFYNFRLSNSLGS